MPNRILSDPPINREITKFDRRLQFEWEQWFNLLYYLISPSSHQRITAANTINVNAKYVALKEADGNYAVILPPPTIGNADLVIEMTERDAGEVAIALTNVEGGSAATTATFDAVGETLILKSRSNKWVVIKELGVTLT